MRTSNHLQPKQRPGESVPPGGGWELDPRGLRGRTSLHQFAPVVLAQAQRVRESQGCVTPAGSLLSEHLGEVLAWQSVVRDVSESHWGQSSSRERALSSTFNPLVQFYAALVLAPLNFGPSRGRMPLGASGPLSPSPAPVPAEPQHGLALPLPCGSCRN